MDIGLVIGFNIILFMIGLWGILVNRKTFIVMLLSVELLGLSVMLNFAFFSSWLDDITGQVYALLLVSIIGAESALGLALVLLYARIGVDIITETLSTLKG